MKTLHAKSPCCRGKIYHFGNRRKQCAFCRRTWRIRKRKRGRKRHRINKDLLVRTLIERQTLKQQVRDNYSSLFTLRRRFRNSLKWITSKPREYSLSSTQLILLADGLWFRFKRQDWILYLMAIKSIEDNKAILLDPILLPGKESYENWDYTISTIPERLRSQIKAFVSDNFTCAKKIAQQYHWVHQLCHFHLIAQLQIRRGKRKPSIAGRNTRETIYLSIREALETSNKQDLRGLKVRLEELSIFPECPKRLRFIVCQFLRSIDLYRTYLYNPDLDLPTTTSAIEAVGKKIRQISRTISTPEALRLWTTAFVRLNPIVTCNGKINQIKLS